MKLVDEPILAANQKLQVIQRLELAIDRGAAVTSAGNRPPRVAAFFCHSRRPAGEPPRSYVS
jgi:hypothetical protein